MKKKTHNRLLNLARHLGSKALQDFITNKKCDYKCHHGDNNIECFYWAFEEFPKVFPEWRYDKKGKPFLKGKAELNSFSAASYFLQLDVDAMFHLFVSGYQMPDQFYGEELSSGTTPGQLCDHIYDFLFAMQIKVQRAKQEANKDLLITKKISNHETNKHYLSGLCA